MKDFEAIVRNIEARSKAMVNIGGYMIHREAYNLIIDKPWQWIVDWVFENAPHEVFDELMSSREDYIKAMEE